MCGFLFLSACRKEEEEIGSFPPVLFQYQEIYGSGVTYHKGWFIDTSGNVKAYNLPVNWVFPDEQNFISEEDLNSNVSKADVNIGQADLDELFFHSQLIDDVDPANQSEPECVVGDIGIYRLYCYIWRQPREAAGFYEAIELAEAGNCSQRNLDPQAVEITSWLIELGQEVDDDFGF